jgi:glycyl-tRNA synthetase beta subunit
MMDENFDTKLNQILNLKISTNIEIKQGFDEHFKNLTNLLTTKEINIKQGLNIVNIMAKLEIFDGTNWIQYNKQKFFYEGLCNEIYMNFNMPKIDPDLLQHDSEKDLVTLICLIKLKPFEISQRMEDLSELGEYLNAFMNNVRVETDSPALTQNRKNILRFITCLFDDVADFSCLQKKI